MREKGQTMIEVLLALAIGVIIIAGIGKAVNTSLSSSQFSKNQSSANQYAQEGIEFMRNLRSSNSSAFNGLSGSYCLAKGQTTVSSQDSGALGCPQNVDVFAREVYIEQNSGDCGCTETNPINITKVTATVGWSDSKCGVPPTPTPTRAPCIGDFCPSEASGGGNCSHSGTISNLRANFCHRVQVVSCFSGTEAVPTP